MGVSGVFKEQIKIRHMLLTGPIKPDPQDDPVKGPHGPGDGPDTP